MKNKLTPSLKFSLELIQNGKFISRTIRNEKSEEIATIQSELIRLGIPFKTRTLGPWTRIVIKEQK